MTVDDQPVLHLEGEWTPLRQLVGDLWRRRSLLPMLARKDFHARYRSATIGVLWSVLLPLFQGAVLAFVFTRFVEIEVDADRSYAIFVVSGIVAWGYLTQSVTAASTAIVDNAAVAGKVYFPRLLLPAVPPCANAVSFVVSLAVTAVLAVAIADAPGLSLLVLPVAVVLTALLAAVAGALLAMAHVYFRDVRYVVQASLLVGLYATPVIYPLELAGDYEWALLANPVTGCVQLTRFGLLGTADSLAVAVASTGAWILGLAVAALVAYARHERIAVDRL